MKKLGPFLLILLLSACITDRQKEFELYDAMTYPGKPDLTSEGLLPVYLMYEAALTKEDPDNARRAILDMDMVNMQAELAATFPHVMVSTDIEDWFGNSAMDEEEMYSRFSTMFGAFREKNNNVVIGNYGIAPSALCVYRYYNKEKEDSVLIENWKKNNAKRWKSLETVDVIMPVVYIAEPDIESWIRDLDITISEIKKYDKEKKVVVYIWPQYYNKPDSPYDREVLSPKIWKQMLEAVHEKCDGAIIWSSRTDGENKTLHWNDPRIQAIWEETANFIDTHGKNMRQPLPDPDLIMMDDPSKPFKIFASLHYRGTPDLAPYGIHEIKLVNEKDVSTNMDSNKIYTPDMKKIEALAEESLHNPNMPVCITGGTWIRDRGANPEDMIKRYELVRTAFKSKNSENQLGFGLVGPPSLSGLRVSIGNFYVNTAGWMQASVAPTRPLRGYSDYLVPAAYIIDDDIDLWKKEFYLTIREARCNNPEKPIYAYFYTDYFNQKGNFAESYSPIKEGTWEAMLDAAFKLCDGIVMSNIGNVEWNENFGFWKATQQFIEKYENNIVFPFD